MEIGTRVFVKVAGQKASGEIVHRLSDTSFVVKLDGEYQGYMQSDSADFKCYIKGIVCHVDNLEAQPIAALRD